MKKEIKYKDDVSIYYMCGCSESRLEYPENWEKVCKEHSDEKKMIDFQLRQQR